MGEYIKVNLPRTPADYESGNGEGVWMMVDKETKAAYDNDEIRKGFTGILANDSLYFPGLNCGTTVPFEMRGIYKPVADFTGFLAKLNPISDGEKDALISHIMEEHPDVGVVPADSVNHWKQYIEYLIQWANEHESEEFAGMTPAGYDEWLCNEGQLDNECQEEDF